MTKMKWKGKRIVGCASTNHASCKGELWKCERCHKTICWDEGSTDLIYPCDKCWHDVKILGKVLFGDQCMKQHEAVIVAMKQNGGYSTLGQLCQSAPKIPGSSGY